MKKQQKDLSKRIILKESGLIVSCYVLLSIALISLIPLCLIKERFSVLLLFIWIVCVAVFLATATAGIKDLFYIIKILSNQFVIYESPILSIRFRNVYSADKSRNRVLELINMNITVDEFTANKYNVGNVLTVVFVKNVRYPVLIAKSSIFSKAK